MKTAPTLRDIPVIMISALDEIQSVVRCIEGGAEDYLPKPFDPVLLRARIGACLEKKRLREAEKRRTEQLEKAIEEVETQRCVTESLLLNILPAQIAGELRANGSVEPRYYEDVTILFTDFVGFTLATENLAAEDLVNALNRYFTAFDRIVTNYGLEKLKTVGDAYMLSGGLPTRSPSHPVDALLAAFEIARAVDELSSPETPWPIRIGVHTGPVFAGVVGIKKFAFDVWGETVNYASRMESCGAPGRINISARTHSRVKDFFECENRGRVTTKEGKEMEMYFVNGILPKLVDDLAQAPPPAFVRRYKVYFQKEPPAFPKFLLSPR
jgi:class 3 adenylate cyclase